MKLNNQALQRRMAILWWEGGEGGNSSGVVITNQVSDSSLSTNNVSCDKNEKDEPYVHCAVVNLFLERFYNNYSFPE